MINLRFKVGNFFISVGTTLRKIMKIFLSSSFGLILLLCLLFCLVTPTYSFANWSQDEFERTIKQVWSFTGQSESNLNSMLSSSAYLLNVNDIPFGDYDSIVVRYYNQTYSIGLFTNNCNFIIGNNGWINTDIERLSFDFGCNLNWTGYPGSPVFTYDEPGGLGISNTGEYYNVLPQNARFTILLTNNTIINQYNYTIYGLNYSLSTPVYNGSTNVDVGQYYRLCQGFIGSYYYSNYEDLDYQIVCNDTTNPLYTGLKNIYYTPTTNGNIVEIYIYVENSMDGKRL